MRFVGRFRRRASASRHTSRCSARSPAASSTDTAPCGPPPPNTSVASARIVPGEPSGNSTTNNNTPFHRLNDRAANSRPNNGCVSAITRTSHGNTARNCCSLSPSLRAPAKPTSPSGWRSGPAKPATGSCSPPPPNGSPGSPKPTTPAASKPNSSGSGRYPLLVVDEVGYIPFEPEAANLFFQLVSSRYERASLIVTSNKPFGRWGEVFGDDVVAAAMIDRLVHHAEVIALKGDSYRLKDRDLGESRDPPPKNEHQGGQFSTVEKGSIFGRR